jgi:hypothetical protein
LEQAAGRVVAGVAEERGWWKVVGASGWESGSWGCRGEGMVEGEGGGGGTDGGQLVVGWTTNIPNAKPLFFS